MSIKDVRGIEVSVGDTVAFAGGGRGASEFYVGKVTKINPATVTITEYKYGKHYDLVSGWVVGTYEENTIRKDGMFAILEKAE